jgi:two-component sensor histidine kinase
MALLHKKMNVSDNVNEIDLEKYVAELAELVKDSYAGPKKKIELKVQCRVKKISIEKALPIGLIIVELVSNSIKHAFKKRSVGLITIDIYSSEILGKNVLYYADSGDGYDFNKVTDKGLGQEIIKGLIDQLDGTFETQSKNGFELTIYFQ